MEGLKGIVKFFTKGGFKNKYKVLIDAYMQRERNTHTQRKTHRETEIGRDKDKYRETLRLRY